VTTTLRFESSPTKKKKIKKKGPCQAAGGPEHFLKKKFKFQKKKSESDLKYFF